MRRIMTAAAISVMFFSMISGYTNSSAKIIYPFVDIAPCARAAALADSVCGMNVEESGYYFSNPSVLASLKNPQLNLTYGRWFVDTSYQNLTGASNFNFGAMGFQLLYVNHGSFDRRDDFGALLNGTVESYNVAVSAAYAMKPMAKLSAGIAVKTIIESDASDVRGTACADIGAMYEFEKMTLGMALNNIGADAVYGLPFTIRAGVSAPYTITQEHKLMMGLDTKYILNDEMTISAGIEYGYAETAFARLGYKLRTGASSFDAISGFTFGTGVKAAGLAFDYALVPFTDLGFTHRVTVSYVFGAAVKKPAAKKAAGKDEDESKTIMQYFDAVTADKNDIKAWKKLARAHDLFGNIEMALKTVNEALTVAPNDKELIKMKGDYGKILNKSGK